MKKIGFREFMMDESIVSPCIYAEMPHRTTNIGLDVSSEVTAEIGRFLAGYNQFVAVERTPYYRIDAYFTEQSISILEINAWFVDGWGTALNLARASGVAIDPACLKFPEKFTTLQPQYYPELRLFVDELAEFGIKGEITPFNRPYPQNDTYVYDRITTREKCWPYDGRRIDNKMNLARYASEWDSPIVQVPKQYFAPSTSWNEVPPGVVVKACDNITGKMALCRGVAFGKKFDDMELVERFYEGNHLLAQDYISPTIHNGRNCQLIILAIGDEPITGYVQYSKRKVINDDSIHGPVLIN